MSHTRVTTLSKRPKSPYYTTSASSNSYHPSSRQQRRELKQQNFLLINNKKPKQDEETRENYTDINVTVIESKPSSTRAIKSILKKENHQPNNHHVRFDLPDLKADDEEPQRAQIALVTTVQSQTLFDTTNNQNSLNTNNIQAQPPQPNPPAPTALAPTTATEQTEDTSCCFCFKRKPGRS